MSNKTNNYQIAGDTTITTTGNIDDLDVKGYSLLRMNNASLATIRGIRAGYPGQLITIVSVGAGQVNLAHQNTNSAAANRLINTVTSGITPLAAGTGKCTYRYDAETARWRLIQHEQGAEIDIAFDAANYTADAGTWTVASGDQITLKYIVRGKLLLYQFNIQTTSVSNAGAFLRLTIPNSYTWAGSGTVTDITRTSDAGATSVPGYARATAGNSYLEFRSNFANAGYAIATDNTAVIGQLETEIT